MPSTECPLVHIKENAMATKIKEFTPEQIKVLQQNQYVLRVSPTVLSFTVEFKKRFWEFYTQGKLMPREILSILGFDTQMLGKARVRGIPYNLKLEYANFGEFTEVRRNAMQKEKYLPDQEMKRLRMEVEYLRQEQEFIKKIISAGREVKSK